MLNCISIGCKVNQAEMAVLRHSVAVLRHSGAAERRKMASEQRRMAEIKELDSLSPPESIRGGLPPLARLVLKGGAPRADGLC